MNGCLLRQIIRIRLVTLMVVFMSALGVVIAGGSENVLIKNVMLIDRYGETGDRSINILIKDTKLSIVTLDEIELEDGIIGYDAQGGVVMGILEIEQPANFMIVDRDPREDIEVLLDTKTHVIFAIRQGIIVRNKLTRIGAIEPEPEEKQRPRWIAYTPPPMALPVGYLDKTKWNRWETRYFSGIFIAAIALDRQRWLKQDENGEQQVGNLKNYDGGEIRAFRLGIAGTFNFKIPLIYTFVIATHAFDKGFDTEATDKITLLDYRLDIPLSRQFVLSVGKQKEPISMERLLLGTQLQMQERPAVVDALFQIRNVGITMNGTAFRRRMTWAIGAFNNWFDASQRFKQSANQIIGRVSGLPCISEDQSHLIHLGLGVRYTDGKEGIYFRTSPEFNQSPVFVETGLLEARKAITYDLEVSARKGPYWLASEIIRNRVDSPQLENPIFQGFHVSGSWILTHEMRSYDKRNGTFGPVPVSRSRSVYQGGIGAWEVAARYSSLDLSDKLVDGGKLQIFSLGINWWLTPAFSVNLNYRYIILNRYGVRGGSHGMMARVILMLE